MTEIENEPVQIQKDFEEENLKLKRSIHELQNKLVAIGSNTEKLQSIVNRAAEGDSYIAMRIFRIWIERYLIPGLPVEQQGSRLINAMGDYADEQFQIELLTELSSHGLSYDEYADAILGSGRDELKSTLKSFWEHGFRCCFGMFAEGGAFKHITRALDGVEIEE